MPTAIARRLVQSYSGWQYGASTSVEPRSWVKPREQRGKLVRVKEQDIECCHLLAEERGVDQREDRQVKGDSQNRDPAPGRPEPQEECEGELDKEPPLRHRTDRKGIIRQPLEVELPH